MTTQSGIFYARPLHRTTEATVRPERSRIQSRHVGLRGDQPARSTPRVISEFISLTRYARYLPEAGRRETYLETSARARNMHLDRYPQIAQEIEWAWDFVDRKRVLPSMRSFQFAGAAQRAHHAKGYNCAFSVCNRIEFFAEALYLLMAGTGVGYSVQWRHVGQLPALGRIDRSKVKHHVIADTIEGWANAARELLMSYVEGYWVEFAYHRIRPEGSKLKTSGGRAAGHLILRDSLERVRAVLDKAQGRKLQPIECYDITCLLADAVNCNGIREAATLCLFSLDDPFMMHAKTGNWHETHPWRSRSNNSVVLVRDEVTESQFKQILAATRQWGEPGFFFTDDPDTGANPCVEIGLNPKLTITSELKPQIEAWAKAAGREIPQLNVGDVYWGWQLCNLTEVNCAACSSAEDLYEQVRAATIIGTCQAGYTDFSYLGWVSEAICNREALLGVSLTGMMDCPDISLDPQVQKTAARIAVETNARIAGKIGINAAARVTCVKPSGTASLVVGAVGSGIHTHHAKRYFRRIRANANDPVYKHFRDANPHMCTETAPGKALITFPVMAPEGSLTRHDLTAVQFLKAVMSTMRNWVLHGTARAESSPGVNHNVSNTITVKEHEWDEVAAFIWENRRFFTGVSLLADVADKLYQNAPREEVTTEADEIKWRMLIDRFNPVDWSQLAEREDNTARQAEAACAGGSCVLSY